MPLVHVFNDVENRSTGIPQSGITVRAFDMTSDTQIAIFLDSAGTNFPTANETMTDDTGMYFFYVADTAIYRLRFYDGSVLIRTIDNAQNVGPVGATGPANSTYATTAALEASVVTNLSAILSEAGKAGTFTIREYADFTAQVAADPGKINYIRSTSDTTKVWVRASILIEAAGRIGSTSGLTVQTDLNARPTSAFLATAAGAASIGSTGPSNVQTDLNARPTSATLAASSGSSLVGFLQSGTPSATARAVQSKLRDVKSAQDWAAFPDGAISTAAMLTAVTNAWNAALNGDFDLYFPEGVYDIGDASFPWRQSGVPVSLLDCKDITIHGSGPNTVFKTTSAGGADVFQLNGVKNLHFRNFRITATLTGSLGSGSNAISVTGGYDNITVLDVWMENLPSIDATTFIDGGKALTIQCDAATLEVGSLTARIYAKGCSQGFGFESGLVNMLTKKVSCDIDVIAEDCFSAVTIGGAAASGAIPAGTHTGIRVRGQAVNCQKGVFLARAHGVEVDMQVISTKTAANKRLNPQSVAWMASDTVVEALQCAYAKNSQARVTGNAGACDYKARIGGATAGSSGLLGTTEYCDIFLDLAGTAATSDIAEIDSGGNTLNNSTLTVTPTTGTIPAVFRTFANNNIFPNDGNRRAVVRMSADQIGQNYTAGVTLAWDQEVFDTSGFHDNVTNNSRLTIPAGVQQVRLRAHIQFANVTANDTVILQIRKNGSATYDGTGVDQAKSDFTIVRVDACTAALSVSPGDFFEVLVQVNSDVSVDITASSTWFEIEVIR